MAKINKKRLVRLVVLTAFVILALYALLIGLQHLSIGYKCPFFAVTGLSCAGCGNTRAVSSLLKLDFVSALKFNYLFPLEIFYILWVYFFSAKSYLQGKVFNYVSPCKILDVITLVAIVIWSIVRNVLGV